MRNENALTDTPTLTDIVQSDDAGSERNRPRVRLVIENENLPKLIEALQRRYEDCKRDPEA